MKSIYALFFLAACASSDTQENTTLQNILPLGDSITEGVPFTYRYPLHNQLSEQGKAVLMISSELPEILGMTDRIIVMNEGRITGEIGAEDLLDAIFSSFCIGK